MIEGQEGDNGTDLRQQIDAEHMIADRAERDVGKPGGERRTEVGSDLVLPAESQQGRQITGRAAIEQHRQDQPKPGLEQHHEPDHQPRPGADQFDNERGEAHEMSEMPGPSPLPEDV